MNANVAQYSLSASADLAAIRTILVSNGDRTAEAASAKGIRELAFAGGAARATMG